MRSSYSNPKLETLDKKESTRDDREIPSKVESKWKTLKARHSLGSCRKKS